MTFARSDRVLSRFSRVPNSRAALALAHVVSDSQIWEQLFPFESSKLSGTATDGYFDTLLNQPGCWEAWNAYTNVTTPDGFPHKLASGTVSLNGFRHYWIQDAIYLEYYVRVRLEAFKSLGDTVSVDEIRKFIHTAKLDIDAATKLRDDCEKKLGVPSKDITDELKSDKLNASIKQYESVVKGAKPWIDIHFAFLPCIKGYYQIATDLLNDSKVVKNTVYYTMWIKRNTNDFWVKDYDTLLEAAAKNAGSADWERWGQIFKTACENEKNLFELATKDYKQYDILEKGDYTISPYGYSTHFLDVNDGEVVVATDSVKWQLENSAEGYTISSKNLQQYLGWSTNDTGLPFYEVQTGTTLQAWSINPVRDGDGNTVKGYQLFPTDKQAFVLDWNPNNAKSKAFVAINYQGPSQTWALKAA